MNRQLKQAARDVRPEHPEPDQEVDEGTEATRGDADRKPEPPADGSSNSAGQHARGPPAPICASTPTTRCTGSSGLPRRWPWRRERDVPILLSIGYAACHWCHVMAHESFEDAEVAAADEREFRLHQGRPRGASRPRRRVHERHRRDDRAGRLADDLLPHSRRAPFFCGTYYPKAASFLQLLAAVADTWRTAAARWSEASDSIAGELRSMASAAGRRPAGDSPSSAMHAVAAVLRDEDTGTAGSAARRSFRRRRCWRRCCATTNGPAARRRWQW